jgi:cytochrome c oxidase subunit 1
MIFATPTGLHHQFADPGVSSTWKAVHTVFTLMVAVPSFMTAFNIGATLEMAGRNRGGKGAFGWMFTQKWSDPVVSAQLMGMLQFITGGITGLINASAQINTTIHNTSWVPAHFHQTVGGAVAMTFIGIMYWLLPMIRGRALWSKKVAVAQVYTWGIGMTIFGHTMAEAGLNGVPRRTLSGMSPYLSEAARYWLDASAISGVILLISLVLLYLNILMTLFGSKSPVEEGGYVLTKGDAKTPAILDNWKLWIFIAVALVVAAWTVPLIDAINISEGFTILRYSPAGPVPLK